jgi:uncharacterized repeat protein (TIGR01451 family)
MVRGLWNFFTITILFSLSLEASWWNNDWKHRVAITIHNAVTHQTGKLNIDFSTLGLLGDLDENSIRVVKEDGTLLAQQEFTDILYNGVTDSLNNNRGEVKFIIEESGELTYYIYYDSIENGSKEVLSSTYVINGNFEHSSTSTVTNWSIGQSSIGTNNPNNEVHPLASEGTTLFIDGEKINNTAYQGEAFFLHGYRDRAESGNMSEVVYVEKTFNVPSTAYGNLTYWFRVQAFDDINYDYVQVKVNGNVINHTNLNISNSNLSVTSTKYGRKSSYGGYQDIGWTKATLNLLAYAGTTITVRISHHFFSDNNYKSWQLIDDFEWSLNSTFTLGVQENQENTKLEIIKSSCVLSDLVNGTLNPKRIPGATLRYAFEVTNKGSATASNVLLSDTLSAEFDVTTIQKLQVQNGACDCLGMSSSSNNGVNGTANGVHPIVLDFGNLLGGSVATPTKECGYFEVELR